MADVVENEAKMAYMRPPGRSAAAADDHRGPSRGFVVREAPWATGSEKVSLLLYVCSVWRRSPVLIPGSFLRPPI